MNGSNSHFETHPISHYRTTKCNSIVNKSCLHYAWNSPGITPKSMPVNWTHGSYNATYDNVLSKIPHCFNLVYKSNLVGTWSQLSLRDAKNVIPFISLMLMQHLCCHYFMGCCLLQLDLRRLLFSLELHHSRLPIICKLNYHKVPHPKVPSAQHIRSQ